MAQDFEQFLREVFGEPFNKLVQFNSDQMKKLNAKLQDIAHEAVRDDFNKLHTEIADLKARLARLENERAQAAADSVQPSF